MKIFKKDLYAYDEEEGAEVEIEGLKAKFIKESFGDVFYLLYEPIEGKGVIREYYSEPMGDEEGTTLYELLESID